ncbi:PadR family transcriptional regulator, partial [Bifidobacterium sp. SMA1]|nr:PadR family transcriptional regulator [Bifidobacterium saimiriisciurei]
VVPDKRDRDAVLRRRYELLSRQDVHFFYCDAGNPLSIDQIDDPYRRGIIRVHDAEIAAELEWLREELDLSDGADTPHA